MTEFEEYLNGTQFKLTNTRFIYEFWNFYIKMYIFLIIIIEFSVFIYF